MNGVPVCLAQKSENAPTWRPRKHNFGPLFWGLKSCIFGPPKPHPLSPCTHNTHPTLLFRVLFPDSDIHIIKQVRLILNSHTDIIPITTNH